MANATKADARVIRGWCYIFAQGFDFRVLVLLSRCFIVKCYQDDTSPLIVIAACCVLRVIASIASSFFSPA